MSSNSWARFRSMLLCIRSLDCALPHSLSMVPKRVCFLSVPAELNGTRVLSWLAMIVSTVQMFDLFGSLAFSHPVGSVDENFVTPITSSSALDERSARSRRSFISTLWSCISAITSATQNDDVVGSRVWAKNVVSDAQKVSPLDELHGKSTGTRPKNLVRQ